MSGLVDAIFGGSDVQIPDTNPGMVASAEAARDVAKMQQDTAKEYLDFSKQQYAELKPIAEKAYASMINLSDKQAAIADANEKRAAEYADFEKNTFRPLEQSLVDEANTYDTEAKREQLASRGMADVATAYQAQRQQALDTLSRYGINPNSNRFAAINASLSRAEAADSAGAANNARLQAEQLGYARKLDATALGRGLATNATAAYGTAINANNASGAQTGGAYSAIAAPGMYRPATSTEAQPTPTAPQGTSTATSSTLACLVTTPLRRTRTAGCKPWATSPVVGLALPLALPQSHHSLMAARFTRVRARCAAPEAQLTTRSPRCFRMANTSFQPTP